GTASVRYLPSETTPEPGPEVDEREIRSRLAAISLQGTRPELARRDPAASGQKRQISGLIAEFQNDFRLYREQRSNIAAIKLVHAATRLEQTGYLEAFEAESPSASALDESEIDAFRSLGAARRSSEPMVQLPMGHLLDLAEIH